MTLPRALILPIILMTLAIPKSQAQKPSTIAGDYLGTLVTGAGDLHLALHLKQSSDGILTGTLDSLDQAANGIPITTVTLTGSKLTLAIAAVHGSYEAEVNPAATQLKGTWTQVAAMPLTFDRAPAASSKPPTTAATPSPIVSSHMDGDWIGTLDAGTAKLRIIFHIITTPAGLRATLDSPDQGAKGIPTTSVTRTADTLQIEIKPIAGGFKGTIAKDYTSITGTWTQGGQSFSLTLTPVKSSAETGPRIRPQDPVRPYPYHEEEVSYPNTLQGDTLAGTVTLPTGPGPFPAVLLITGSGPQDRDEALLGHRPFLVLSDYLTRHGILVLRVDDRGIGKSTGVFATATTADFATDVEAGVAFLKSRPDVDPRRLGLIGHSEGGIIAPMVAARDHDVKFIVLMAGTGVPGDQLILEQARLISIAMGSPAEEAQKATETNRALYKLVVTEKDPTVLRKELHDELALQPNPASEAEIDAKVVQITSPWFRYFLAYDPAPALRKVTCPVLALNGSKDLQVPPAQNLPAIRKALAESGNSHVEADELPGLNHLFQTATTGSPTEYASIDETISPVALDKITTWILKL